MLTRLRRLSLPRLFIALYALYLVFPNVDGTPSHAHAPIDHHQRLRRNGDQRQRRHYSLLPSPSTSASGNEAENNNLHHNALNADVDFGGVGMEQQSRTTPPAPILLDMARCPLGWLLAGESCVRQHFGVMKFDEAVAECRRAAHDTSSTLVDLFSRQRDGKPNAELIADLSEIIDKSLEAGVTELTWLVGGALEPASDDFSTIEGPLYHDVWAKSKLRVANGVDDRPMLGNELGHYDESGDDSATSGEGYGYGEPIRAKKTDTIEPGSDQRKVLALRKSSAGNGSYELIFVDSRLPLPFICALSAASRRQLLYDELLLPRRLLKIVENPQPTYHYSPTARSERGERSFLTLPCRVTLTADRAHQLRNDDATMVIKWFKNGDEEINTKSRLSPYLVSSGSLLIPITESYSETATFHCTASSHLGTVRSTPTVVRAAFIERFRESRLDVYPLGDGMSDMLGGGARIDCQAPRHHPKSHSFSWTYGGSMDRFVSVSERVFISRDGTLYFSYNVPEDADVYACTLALPATQSAQHGPFFRLLLPMFGQLQTDSSGSNTYTMHKYPPKIDEYQPQVFPAIPMKGKTVFIECFAYGYPAPTYKWSRVDGLPISQNSRLSVTNFGRVLQIEATQPEDAVRYKCTAKNEVGMASAEVQLHLQIPPTVLQPMIDKVAAVNDSVEFICGIQKGQSTENGGSLEWFRNGVPLAPLLMGADERARFRIRGTELSISHLKSDDSAIYQCIAGSVDLGYATTSARLSVMSLAPRFHSNLFPMRVVVVEGTKLTLPCVYQAVPRGNSVWRRFNSRHSLPVTHPSDSNSLLIEAAQPSDSGRYECRAWNELGEARASVELAVISPSTASITPWSMPSGGVGISKASTKMACHVEIPHSAAHQEGLFEWRFNDRPLRKLSGGELFRLGQTQVEGKEKVKLASTASNKWTEQRSEMEVPRHFLHAGNVGRFECSSLFGAVVAELEPPVIWTLAPTELKAELGAAVTSQVGAGRGAEALKPSIRVTWRQPTNRNAPLGESERRGIKELSRRISHYQLEYRTGDERRWISIPLEVAHSAHNAVNSFVARNMLKPNQRYQFRVRSRSIDGQLSVPSQATAWIATPRSRPTEAVRNLRFKFLDTMHLLLEWDPIEETHHTGANLRYNVSWSSSRKDKSRQYTSFETVTGTTLALRLPPMEVHGRRRAKQLDATSRYKTEPHEGGIIDDPFEEWEMDNDGNGDPCYVLAVEVGPLNDEGIGTVSTDTVIQVTDQAPTRRADNLRAATVNSTHMNVTWNWVNGGDCENIKGAMVECRLIASNLHSTNPTEMYRDTEQTIMELLRNRRNSSHHEHTVRQYFPGHYTHWLVHGLQAASTYSCELSAFDQYGRWAPTQYGEPAVGKTKEPAPGQRPIISYVRVRDTPDGGFTTLVDWSAVELGGDRENRSDSNRASTEGITGKRESRGYKILLYETETAKQPIVLQMLESELADNQRPSARIDGMKTMFLYNVLVGGFNPGGVGPLSAPVPIRIGAVDERSDATGENGHPGNSASSRVPNCYGISVIVALLCLTSFSRVVHSIQ